VVVVCIFVVSVVRGVCVGVCFLDVCVVCV